jgi:hypothetical protein
MVDDGCGWATFALSRGEGTGGGRIIMLPRRGAIVVAYESPTADDDGARRSAEAVRDGLAGSRAPSPPVDVREDAASVEPLLDGTVELRDAVLGPALPFVNSDTAGGAEEKAAVPRQPVRMATGTEDVDVAKLREALMPFARGRASSAPAAPIGAAELSLEDYALLRASLMIHGEDDAATLASFGIRSRDEKSAIQARFAALFRGDAAAQARFVALVKRLVETVPRSGVPSTSPAPEPDLDATAEIKPTASVPSRSAFKSTTPLPDGYDSAPNSKKRNA